jgi:hypothetical protein
MAGSMGKDIQSKISRCFPYEANKGTFAVKSSGRLNNKCGKNKCFFRSFMVLIEYIWKEHGKMLNQENEKA